MVSDFDMNAIILLIVATIPHGIEPPRDEVECIELNRVSSIFGARDYLIFWDRWDGKWQPVAVRSSWNCQWFFRGTSVMVFDQPGSLRFRNIVADGVIVTESLEVPAVADIYIVPGLQPHRRATP